METLFAFRSALPAWRSFLSNQAVGIALAVIFLANSLPYALKASDNASAFVRWHNQIQELDSGSDIYQRHNYPNPPTMALLLYPLMQLPPVAGALCWYYLKAGMALLALCWTFRLVEGTGRPFPLGAKVLTALLCLRPLLGDLSHGNVNLFILFLVVAALYAFHHGRDALAGGVLALAIACKVTPALFVPYFLWKRAWKTLAGCALGLVLVVGLLPALCLGWERNLQLIDSWVGQMVTPYITSGQVLYTEHNNQSLPAVVLRLTTASPSFSTWVGEEHVPVRYDNFLDLSPQHASWIVKGCLVLFAGLVVCCCRLPLHVRRDWRFAAECSLIFLGMLLFSERTWKHHAVMLLVPCAVLTFGLTGTPSSRQRLLLGVLAGAWLLMTATSTGAWTTAWAKTAQAYGAFLWAELLLLVGLVVLLRSDRGLAVGAKSSPCSPGLQGHGPTGG